MLFNSYAFILLFLPIVLGIYFGLNKLNKYTLSKMWLLLTSMVFCAWLNYKYLVVLIVSILVNYGVYLLLQIKRTKWICAAGIVINVAGLGYFKYCNFFLENINFLFKTNFDVINIVIPLGISFYTFQQIAFLVDCYKDSGIHYDFPDYCVYICYFPKLIQGPIAYHHEIIGQINEPSKRKWNDDNVARGLYLFALGLGKKVLLADVLAGIVTVGYGNISALNAISAIVVTLSYTLQIYFDFSGYCDMAAGISYMFNIELPLNFDLPYQARSVSQFWKRWHITLTRFFTKYIYIPLGGSRKGIVRTCVNTLIVFAISGIWHGAAWTFVIWGLIHGTLLVFERLTGRFIERVPKVLGQIITLGIVNIAWVFFRAGSLNDACSMVSKIFTGGFGKLDARITEYVSELAEVSVLSKLDVAGVMDIVPGIFVFALLVISLIFVWKENNTQKILAEVTLTKKRIIITVIVLVWSLVSLTGHSEFIYFYF